MRFLVEMARRLLRLLGLSKRPRTADITAVMIEHKVNEEIPLFILLAADGSINRMGEDKQLYIGVVSEPLFSTLMTRLTDDMLQFMGGYDVPEKRGALCKLAIRLAFTDGSTNGFGFSYGAESQGPPREMTDFVGAARTITEPWYQAQQKMASGHSPKS